MDNSLMHTQYIPTYVVQCYLMDIGSLEVSDSISVVVGQAQGYYLGI